MKCDCCNKELASFTGAEDFKGKTMILCPSCKDWLFSPENPDNERDIIEEAKNV